MRIITFGSRSLASAETKYHSSKLEFLKLKWAVIIVINLHIHLRLKFVQITILLCMYRLRPNCMLLTKNG